VLWDASKTDRDKGRDAVQSSTSLGNYVRSIMLKIYRPRLNPNSPPSPRILGFFRISALSELFDSHIISSDEIDRIFLAITFDTSKPRVRSLAFQLPVSKKDTRGSTPGIHQVCGPEMSYY